MAESVAKLVVQQLADLIKVLHNQFGELRGDPEFIKGEFERMTTFLRVADDMGDKDPDAAVWVRQVREVAHDTEDVLDKYDLLFSSHRGCVHRIFASIKHLRARSQLASELRNIKSRVRNISEGHQRYSGRSDIQDQVSGWSVATYSKVHGREAAVLQDEADLVGILKRKGELLNLLFDGDSKSKAVSVVGMGGVGKTTLLRNVYKDVEVTNKFECKAWVTVSASYDIKELLRTVIKQLCAEVKVSIQQEVQSMDENELREFIKDFLQQRKYIVVFDDVWDINLLDTLKYTLNSGSSHGRILLTTRNKKVASIFSVDFSGYIYNIGPLSHVESQILFCRKVFKHDYCPPHLKDISERILNKCGGLPLAIVAIGGILALEDKERIDNWEMIYRRIAIELEGDGELDGVQRILLLSFFDLPHHLKVCLLYLSIFPEDHEMEFMQVIRLWVAEGFVEEKEGLTMEEVGESYLNELVNRSLLQVLQTSVDGRLEAFCVHDILREIIISKSKKENIATIVGEGTVNRWPNKVRRLAIQGPVALENRPVESNKFRHMRSLVLFSAKDLPPKPLLSQILCGGLKLLKVLDLRGAQLEVIPDEFFKLFLLTYLSLRSTNVKIIPKSIGKLRNLETLDLKQTFVTVLPVEILELRRLRHLLAYRYCRSYGYFGVQSFRFPYKIGSLLYLQKLSIIEADERNGVKIVSEIGKLTQLRRLGIRKLRKEDGKDLCSSLERLTNLRSLAVASVEENEIIDLQYNLCSIPHLLRGLWGRLEKVPQWIHSLRGLTHCSLVNSRLRDEPLQYFEDLANLARLVLVSAYEGEELHFKAGKFQRLKQLILKRLRELRSIRIEKSSMSCLELLEIDDCKLMEQLPSGIEYLSKLQELIPVDMEEELVRPLLNGENRSTQAKIRVGTLKHGSYEWRYA